MQYPEGLAVIARNDFNKASKNEKYFIKLYSNFGWNWIRPVRFTNSTTHWGGLPPIRLCTGKIIYGSKNYILKLIYK